MIKLLCKLEVFIYRLLLEHKEYLENEKKKMEEVKDEEWIRRTL